MLCAASTQKSVRLQARERLGSLAHWAVVAFDVFHGFVCLLFLTSKNHWCFPRTSRSRLLNGERATAAVGAMASPSVNEAQRMIDELLWSAAKEKSAKVGMSWLLDVLPENGHMLFFL